MKLERPLIAFDLETTGLNFHRDRVVQIGVVKLFSDGHEKEWENLFNPGAPISPEATAIHGIDDTMIRDAPVFGTLAKGIQQAFQGADVCGYNVQFDLRFMKAEYKRLNRSFEHGKIVDAYKIYQREERRDLNSAVKFYLGEKHEGAHTALSDARASLRVFQAQLKRYPDLPQTVDELHHLFFERVPEGYLDMEKKIALRNGEPCLAFGKHNGVPLTSVPPDYFRWMLEQNFFSDQVKKIVKETMEGITS